jgi:hypothetical protein
LVLFFKKEQLSPITRSPMVLKNGTETPMPRISPAHRPGAAEGE